MKQQKSKKKQKQKNIKLENYESKIAHVKSCIKIHTCSWCHQPIPIGSEFYKYAMSFDGSHEQVKLHPDCFNEILEEAKE